MSSKIAPSFQEKPTEVEVENVVSNSPEPQNEILLQERRRVTLVSADFLIQCGTFLTSSKA